MYSSAVKGHVVVQCSAVQCSAVQCSAVQCSAVQCSAVLCSAVQAMAVVLQSQVATSRRGALHSVSSNRYLTRAVSLQRWIGGTKACTPTLCECVLTYNALVYHARVLLTRDVNAAVKVLRSPIGRSLRRFVEIE